MNDPFHSALPDLEEAIATDQLQLFYQPQVTADGRRVGAVEALARWRHAEVGWIPPSVFVAYAERTGLIEALGGWCLRRACREALLWPEVTVSVNVSPIQFRNENFVNQVLGCLEQYEMPGSRIELEITEGAVFDDLVRAENTMLQFQNAGVRLALDDFGTGYSSLSYLKLLPWDKVKIDKSFVDDVGHMKSAAIIHATVALARAIGLKITAEGVETVEQQKFLKLAGCHYLQGYLLSRPVPAREFFELLTFWNSYPMLALC